LGTATDWWVNLSAVRAEVSVVVERGDAVDVGAVFAGVNYLPGGGLGVFRGADEIWG